MGDDEGDGTEEGDEETINTSAVIPPKGIKFKNSGSARAFNGAFLIFVTLWFGYAVTLLQFTRIPGIGVLIGLIGGLIVYLIGTVFYTRYRYCILPDRILLKHGVISRNYLDIPMIRIQSVMIYQTVAERFFGVGSLHLETAGALDWDAWIYSIKNFDQIANYILHQSEEARLAKNVPRMMRSSPDPGTVRALMRVEADMKGVFGRMDPHLKALPLDVMNKRFHMSPKMRWVWGIEASTSMLILWGFLWLGLVFSPTMFTVVLLLGLLLVLLVSASIYSSANYYNYTFHFERDALAIRHGIINKSGEKFPYKRIQNINLSSSYFGRKLGLHSIVVETGGGYGMIHGIEDPDPVVNFLLEQAEDARFDDALGDASELEDYHLKILKQVKKINYRLKERLGRFDNPYDHSTPELKARDFLHPMSERFFVASSLITSVSAFNIILIIIFSMVYPGMLLIDEVQFIQTQNHVMVFDMPVSLFIPLIWISLCFLSLPFLYSFSLWYGRKIFQSFVLRFDYDSLFSRYGVFTINDEMVPYRRIQNAYIEQGILESMYGIKSVIVCAPGMYRRIPGVKNPEALVTFVLRKAEEARIDEAHDMEANVVTEIAWELKEMNKHLMNYLRQKGSMTSKA
jgi:membrane protein YdbS with pleckstrin-like domain